MAKRAARKQVTTLTHEDASRKNIPTAEYQAVMEHDDRHPVQVAYERRNRDLDPQLVWRGKDVQDWSDLVVPAPPVFIQEKVHPKVLIDDLLRRSKEGRAEEAPQPDLFADFNGLPSADARTEFYRHDANWSNRMILGDSLQVMVSLAEREGLQGKVQCIYIDPPYGIKFNSNFQWSTTSRDVRDGKAEHITREPEQVKAFRDTWRDGIHSYLTYLRDRLTVARDLLADSGSVFVQIGDENVHRVRAVMDEVFGEKNFVSEIVFLKTTGKSSGIIDSNFDMILWFCKGIANLKFRRMLFERTPEDDYNLRFVQDNNLRRWRIGDSDVREFHAQGADFWRPNPLTSQTPSDSIRFDVNFQDRTYTPGKRGWSTNEVGMSRIMKADRLWGSGRTLSYIRYLRDAPMRPHTSFWTDTRQSGFGDEKLYVVQTARKAIERCILMTTDPGDLVLDPTCGAGTTAYVAEQWGRRWVTIDTSRVALALARARVMGARYPYYLLADSPEGQRKEAALAGKAPSETPTYGNVRHGFVYERVPHITLKSIANNAEIDVIHEQFQATLGPLRDKLNAALKEHWEEWEIPRTADDKWSAKVKTLHAEWWKQRIARQQAIDASIAAKADSEYLYDKPYADTKKVRVAGPFTVESLSPHRVLGVDEHDELIDNVAEARLGYGDKPDFAALILDNLRTAGVQQAHKDDRIVFSSLTPWPGDLVCAEGRYGEEEETERDEGRVGRGKGKRLSAAKRAAIFIGPEFGTVSRPDLVDAAREAAEAGFDVLVACAFNFDAHASEFGKLGRIPILKARMNADLHMAGDLKNTGKGNLFVIFGEPDVDLLPAEGGDEGRILVRINGVDVFHPNTGEVRSDGPEGIACWFIDTDYDGESFFVRHAYFLGAGDPYKALKTTLKAEVDADAWATLQSDTSRPFPKPASGRIAVKVINHLGDEVMKVFQV